MPFLFVAVWGLWCVVAFSYSSRMSSTLPATTGAPPLPPDKLEPALTRRQESYARCVAAGMSYSEAFRQAGLLASSAGAMSARIGELNKTPKVRDRIRALRIAADKDTVSTIAERMAWLRMIINANPDELSRLVTDPCEMCWPDSEVAKAWAAHLAPPPDELAERPSMPDAMKPRHDCIHCRGLGHQRVVLTPTDQLSPEGRALFQGASQDKDGVIKIQMHDQIAAAEMLNKLQSAYVTRSLNLNANVAVHPARDVPAEDALKLFEAFK